MMKQNLARKLSEHGPRAASRPDPVFAKIETHRAAKRFYERCRSYEDEFPDEISRQPCVGNGMMRDYDGNRTPYYLRSKQEIEAAMVPLRAILGNSKWGREQYNAKKQQLLTGLRQDEIALKKAQDDAGYTAAARAYRRASAAQDRTYKALLGITPTTASGMAALAKYIAENERIWLDGEKENACFKTLQTLATCVRRFEAVHG